MTRSLALTARLAALVTTAACASAPPATQPEIGMPVPPIWSATSLGADAATGAASEDEPAPAEWWRGFGDPSLDAAIAEALDGNRDLRTAAARLDAAAALARVSAADEWPVVGAGVTAARRRQNFIGLPIPGAEGSALSTQVSTFGVSLDTAWEADLWGRVRSGVSASLADAEAAAFDVGGARQSIAARTARTWFALIDAGQQLRLAEETVATYRTTTGQVRDRYERGLRPSIDLRLTLANLHTAEALEAQRREQYGRVLRQFELLLGRYPAGTLQPPDTLPVLPGDVPIGLPADLLAQRPDLRAAERRIAAADARFVASRRALYPSLSLTGSTGIATNALRRLLDGDFSVWSLAGSLTQPLFQGGRLRARVDVADAQTREALESYASLALTAFAEVESALDAEAHLRDRASRLEQAVDQARAARTLAEERYASGLEPILSVLDAQRRQLDAESQLLAIRRLQLESRIDLHLALGGEFLVPQATASARPATHTD